MTVLTHLCVRWQRWLLCSTWVAQGKGIQMVPLFSVVSQKMSCICMILSLQGKRASKYIQWKTLQIEKKFCYPLPKFFLLKKSPVLLELRMILHVHAAISLLSQISHKGLSIIFKYEFLSHKLKAQKKVYLPIIFNKSWISERNCRKFASYTSEGTFFLYFKTKAKELKGFFPVS